MTEYTPINDIIFCSVIPLLLLVVMKNRPKDLKQFLLLMPVLFLIIGFFENITYFIDYLPHKELYTLLDGKISDLPRRHYGRGIGYAYFQLNGESYGNIPVHIGFFENCDMTYRFGVRKFPSGAVTAVRIQPVLGDGTVIVTILEIWGILTYLLKPACEDA